MNRLIERYVEDVFQHSFFIGVQWGLKSVLLEQMSELLEEVIALLEEMWRILDVG